MSLQRASKTESIQHQNHMGSTEFVVQPLIYCNPELVLRDPTGLVKTKGRSKIATRLRSRMDIISGNKRKGSCRYCGGAKSYFYYVGKT